mmetsp:Transcript_3830/g.4852  ORF Transcript_3830/g.4852 Transcript_3830/m.4852 type:complete len:104 (+) Transcript_3830:2352-2663(+)
MSKNAGLEQFVLALAPVTLAHAKSSRSHGGLIARSSMQGFQTTPSGPPVYLQDADSLYFQMKATMVSKPRSTRTRLIFQAMCPGCHRLASSDFHSECQEESSI